MDSNIRREPPSETMRESNSRDQSRGSKSVEQYRAEANRYQSRREYNPPKPTIRDLPEGPSLSCPEDRTSVIRMSDITYAKNYLQINHCYSIKIPYLRQLIKEGKK